MNFTCKLKNISNNFIEDYLTACGIENPYLYLHPNNECYENPLSYINIKEAVELFHNHINDCKIGIVKDSDMDGDCSAAIIYQFCKMFDVKPVVFYHNGKQHGVHDLTDQILKNEIDFLIVPDAGTNDVDDFRILKHERPNMSILVLDHHIPLVENPYAIIVNNQIGNVNKYLSGAGVTYKFIQAYCMIHNVECPNYKDLVAMSIVSDVCSFIPIENRMFMYEGFTNPKNKFLITLSQMVCKNSEISPTSIGWDISPLSNSLARIEEQEYKNFFFTCLVGECVDDDECAVKEMKRIKRKQDNAIKLIVSNIEKDLDNSHKTIIEFTESDNKNMAGICAMKLSSKYNKPTIILRELNPTMWTGSLRSPVDLLETINNSGLAQCMGHGAACGITVKKSNLKKLINFLDTTEITQNITYDICADINVSDITLDLCKQITSNNKLWGNDLCKPLFHVRLNHPEVSLFKKSTTTLKLFENNISFIKFFCDDQTINTFENIKNPVVDIICELGINEYNGFISPQANIIKWEIIENKSEEFNWDEIFI